jgi:hypothetical protein
VGASLGEDVGLTVTGVCVGVSWMLGASVGKGVIGAGVVEGESRMVTVRSKESSTSESRWRKTVCNRIHERQLTFGTIEKLFGCTNTTRASILWIGKHTIRQLTTPIGGRKDPRLRVASLEVLTVSGRNATVSGNVLPLCREQSNESTE